METNLKPGIKGLEEQIVVFEDTAAKYGSGLVEVFATPAMIAMMEKTCLKSVLPFLPDGFGTVGTKVNIAHIKATPVGMKVFCESELVEVDGRRLVFRLIARDEQGEIGNGQHERFIIDVKKFMSKQ
ncbi:MAG TPA: thioesterase family protein [Bacteroidales bacterium]|nr:thioesterase family protein [Bacteroidales bacterium]